MPTSERIRDHVTRALSVRVLEEPTRIQRGFGNENWRVSTDDGDLLVKLARSHLGRDKLAAAATAHRRAARGGVPVPELLRVELECADFDGRPVRILRFLPGHHPSEVLHTDAAEDRFFTTLGRTLALLHTVECEGFSSRVGGATTFPTWADYVAYRVPQIAGRVDAGGGIPGIDHSALLDRALRIAAAVSPLVGPRIAHRDLYLDNLLAGPDGTLVALLDFDLAEAWDATVDFAKLRWQVLPRFPAAAADALLAGYAAVGGLPPEFEARVWTTEILELINHAANALTGGNQEFAESARARIERLRMSQPEPPARR